MHATLLLLNSFTENTAVIINNLSLQTGENAAGSISVGGTGPADLEELPFTPVHATIMAVPPGMF